LPNWMRSIAILALLVSALGAEAAPLRVVVDLRSNHSDGAHSFEELIALAKARKIDAIAFTEHDRQTIRFAPEPLIRFFGIEKELPSLWQSSLARFFSDLQKARAQHPEIVLLAGVETAPGYRWQWRFPWHWRLVDAEKHLIALGVERPAQIEALPSWRLSGIASDRTFSVLFWIGLFLPLLWIFRKRKALWASFGAVLLMLLVAIALRPAPRAVSDFIDAAHAQGLFVAWAHPGTRSGVRKGPWGIELFTPPYETEVFAHRADAFAALYGDTDTLTEPGGRWDRWMLRWAQRKRPPIWAIAAGDFHAEGEAGEHLGNFPMDIWAEARTPEAIVAALKAGRVVAWGLPQGRDLFVLDLFVEDARGQRARPGGRLQTDGAGLALVVAIADKRQRAPIALRAQLVIDGRAYPVALRSDGRFLRIPLALSPGAHLLRLRIRQGAIRMEANPMAIEVLR